MTKFVKIILKGKKEPIYLPLEKWKKILEMDKNLVAYTEDGEQEWTGKTMNKLEVVYSDYDKDYSVMKSQSKFKLYRNIETDEVAKIAEDGLPPTTGKYEPV